MKSSIHSQNEHFEEEKLCVKLKQTKLDYMYINSINGDELQGLR